MKKNNLLIKLLTLLIIIAAVLPVFYMPAYAVEEVILGQVLTAGRKHHFFRIGNIVC